jgi:hypothetical protein
MKYEINKIYKIKDKKNYCYTAKIIEDNDESICFYDKDNLLIKIPKDDIAYCREVKE